MAVLLEDENLQSNPDGGGIGGQRPHPEQVAEVVEVAAAVPPAAASGSIK